MSLASARLTAQAALASIAAVLHDGARITERGDGVPCPGHRLPDPQRAVRGAAAAPATKGPPEYWTRAGRERRLFLRQVEALETATFLTEVARDYDGGRAAPVFGHLLPEGEGLDPSCPISLRERVGVRALPGRPQERNSRPTFGHLLPEGEGMEQARAGADGPAHPPVHLPAAAGPPCAVENPSRIPAERLSARRRGWDSAGTATRGPAVGAEIGRKPAFCGDRCCNAAAARFTISSWPRA